MRLPSLEDGCESSTGERTEPSHVVFECWERGSFEVLPEKDLGAGGRARPLFIYRTRQQVVSPSSQSVEMVSCSTWLPSHKTLWLLRNWTSEFELSILLKMQSSICAERVPWCWSAISIRSPWGLGVTVGVRWILTLLLQACKGAGGPRETLRCHTQWIPFCLVSVWSILYFLPVAVLSAALEGNRHEIHQFPPGRGKQMPDCLGKCCQVFLQACIKGWRRVRAGWAKISWWAGVGTDAWDVPCAWKTGSRGRCCWLLLPTTVRLGFRSRKGVSPERRRWTTIY